jgi:hypothetical protein
MKDIGAFFLTILIMVFLSDAEEETEQLNK